EALGERLVLIENGIVDPGPPDRITRISERARLALEDEDIAVLFVGQLEPRKGVLDLIEALASARSEGARLVGLIAGDGPLRDEASARTGPAGALMLGQRDDVEALLEA